MVKEFSEILDECVDRINRGEKAEAYLRDYPQYAGPLGSLLQTMTQAQDAYDFIPSENAMRSGRLRLSAALERKRSPSFWRQLLSRPALWASVVGGIVILFVFAFIFRGLMLPGDPGWEYVSEAIPESVTEPNSNYIAAAHTDGNFVFLVSDEMNAIDDFSSLNVKVDKVGLLPKGDSEKWVEFSPEQNEFDLTLLPGEKTQELWRGNIPEGQYSKVLIYITGVNGVLKDSGETIDIKLPSHKLQMSLPFQVSTDNVTSFIYDLTIIKTGKAKDVGKYLLKPQIGESRASQEPLLKFKLEKDENTAIVPDKLIPFNVTNSRKK
jgi:hypothetical protein